MNCPVCSERMREVEKFGVHLDMCPGCKGVWLDRGEMEALLEWAVANGQQAEAMPTATTDARARGALPADGHPGDAPRIDPRHRPDRHHESDSDDDYDDHARPRHDGAKGQYVHGRKKRGAWLMDLFEGFGGD